jgi:hypothetical protein
MTQSTLAVYREAISAYGSARSLHFPRRVAAEESARK